MQFTTLYKKDSKGKLREWRAEVNGSRYRTISGLAEGQQVTSAWKDTFAKNVGRANATTAEEQAVAEVEAIYTKRLDGEYHEHIDDIDKARFYKPMLASKWEDRKDKITYPVYVQPKLDGCVSGDTLVYTESGVLPISEVFSNDDNFVLSYNIQTNETEFKEITNKMKNGVDTKTPESEIYWLKVTLETGTSIKVTSNHRFWIPELGVWREAKDLTTGDLVLCRNSN